MSDLPNRAAPRQCLSNSAYLYQSAFQGMGLGKRLFEFALQEARDLGCDWAWLGVWERNFKAQIFYDKYGFEKFAEHDFPVGDGK